MTFSSVGVPRIGAGAEAPSECSNRAKAVALAQEVLSLQEEYMQKLEEDRKCMDDLGGQVIQLSRRNEELERELAELKSQVTSQAASGGAAQPDSTNNILGFAGDPVFLGDKDQFIQFVLALANGGKSSKQYKQMYQFLLKCFTDADNNFDGRVGYLEFEMLIDAAAFLPRRFGYAPSTPELYATEFDRVKLRLSLFNGLKPKKARAVNNKRTGMYDYISFHTWLDYAIRHITEKAASLTDEKPHSTILRGGEEFQAFILKAVESRKTREYKEFYHYVLKCFVEADKDLDGQVDKPGFNSLMDAEGPQLFGFSPTALEEEYGSPDEKEKARDKLFQSLDFDGSGLISFDTWLEYTYTHICAKSKNIGAAGAVPEVEAAGASLSEPQYPWRV